MLSVSKELGYSCFYINYICDTFSRQAREKITSHFTYFTFSCQLLIELLPSKTYRVNSYLLAMFLGLQ